MKKGFLRSFVVGSIVFALLATSFLSVSQTSAADEKRVLLLNSYHQGLSWTDGITTGVQERFANVPGLELIVEMMDTKRIYDNSYKNLLISTYKHKYANNPVDVIIVSDNNGLNFLLDNRESIWPGVPVVFNGINNFKDEMLSGKTGYTGVVEATDVEDTFDIALKLHPSTKKVYILNDKTTTGQSYNAELARMIKKYDGKVEMEIIDDFAMADLKQQVKTFPQDSLIFMVVINKDNDGQFFTYEESLKMVYENAAVPIYGLWDFYFNQGIVGGKLTSSKKQGQVAAGMALDILKGKDVKSIPVLKESPNEYMFDYKELKRFAVDQSMLPSDSIVSNVPESFYTKYKTLIWITITIIAFLTLIIVFMSINIRQRKRAEKELQLEKQSLKEMLKKRKEELDKLKRRR